MSISKTYTVGHQRFDSFIVSIETDIQRGIFNFEIIGLADKTVGESRSRVLSALRNNGYKSPKTIHQKVTVLLSPAGLKKEGSHFDLPIAVSYLKACGYINSTERCIAIVGELSLDGFIRPIKKVAQLLYATKRENITELILPKENLKDAQLAEHIKVYGVTHIRDVVAILNGTTQIETNRDSETISTVEIPVDQSTCELINKESAPDTMYAIDLIEGHNYAKRALEISLAGKHHIMLYGAPGIGKSLLARSASELLPNLSKEQTLTKMRFEEKDSDMCTSRPPYREPHHTSSYAHLIGNKAKVGEVTLAHNGILFCDELAEFDRRCLESLRQPLEQHTVTVPTTFDTAILPADFIFIGSMNPCRCGYFGSKIKRCICSGHSIAQYNKKISGPVSDRIDLWVYMQEQPISTTDTVNSLNTIINGKSIRENIERIRSLKNLRPSNKLETVAHIKNSLDSNLLHFIDECSKKLKLSRRSEDSILLVAETIADLDKSRVIKREHILEALSYRKREL